MKKLPFFACAFTLALTSGLASCSKDKKEDPTPTSKAQMLAAHDWILSAGTVSYVDPTTGKKTTVDLFDPQGNFTIDDCQKDDYYHFDNSTTTKTYKLNENTVVCSPSDEEKGTWSISTDQTKLTLTPDGDTATETQIKELTDSSLKLSATDLGILGLGGLIGSSLEIELSFRVK